MSFRGRILLLGLAFSWLPLLVLGVVVRKEGIRRLQASQAQRMSVLAGNASSTWQRNGDRLANGALRLAETLADDNEVRAALRALPLPHPRVQEAAEDFSWASGLPVAYILAEGGLIVGASHFLGDVGRVSEGLWAIAGRSGTTLASELPGPAGPITVFATGAETVVGSARMRVLVGLDPATVADIGGADGGVFVANAGSTGGTVPWSALQPLPGGVAAGPTGGGVSPPENAQRPDGLVELGALSVATPNRPPEPGRLVLAWWDPVLPALSRSFDRALLIALLSAGALAAFLAPFLAARLAAPLDRLGDSARRVQMGRLDVRFRGGGGKEFDRLSRFLNAMMDRLRAGVAQVRDAERRATLGELARQVNHDVKNGLVPIRNVLSHLDEAHGEGRDQLAKAFADRRETLSGSLAYLDTLAGQYESVAVHGRRVAADLDGTVARCVDAVRASNPTSRIRADLESGGRVALDPVSLRRVVENVVGNALAAAGSGGTVSLRTRASEERGATEHVLEVSDDGPGIPEADRARVFEPFFTTREGGTGLGLAIVRRMVSDVGGRVSLDSELGKGTTVRIVFPGHGGDEGSALEERRPAGGEAVPRGLQTKEAP